MRRSRRRQLKASAKCYSRSKCKVSPAPWAPFQFTAALNTLPLIVNDLWVRNSSTRASTNLPDPVMAVRWMCLPRSCQQKSSDNHYHQTLRTHRLHSGEDQPAELSQQKAPSRVKRCWQTQAWSPAAKSRTGADQEGERPLRVTQDKKAMSTQASFPYASLCKAF